MQASYGEDSLVGGMASAKAQRHGRVSIFLRMTPQIPEF